MRIGIEAQRIFRAKKHGMDFVALEMIRNLQEIDEENQYFIFVAPGPDRCLSETPNFKIIEFAGAYPIWEQFKLPRKARQLNLDILHSTSNTAPVKCPCQLVVTIHDIIYLESHPLKAKGYTAYQKFGNMYRRWVVRKLFKTAHKIITVSEFEKQRFLESGYVPEERLEVVYNGVGAHFRVIEDEQHLRQIAKKYSLPAKFFLFLGNTDPKKNTPKTIVAYAEYCAKYGLEHKLVIGDLNPDVIKRYLQEAGFEQFFEQIHFTGYINNKDLPAIINLAALFLYPSLRESFGIPLLEGMRCGTPVLSGDFSSMPEIAGEAALLVNVKDTAAISEGMHQLISNSTLRQSYVQKGLERSAQFSWKNTARQVHTLYNRLNN